MREDLKKNQARIVFADPGETTAESADFLGQQLLTEEEKTRRFVRAEDRHDYIVARLLLRIVLSSYFAVEPAEWRFARDARGKPFVISPTNPPSFQFSLSHTRGLVVLLVSLAEHAGVDVEQMERTNDLELVAQRVCSKSELDALRQLAGAEWKLRFFQLWTLKEAYAKARGLGLSLPLQSISFQIDAENVRTEEARDWQFYLKRIEMNHILAAAVRFQTDVKSCDFALRKIRLTRNGVVTISP